MNLQRHFTAAALDPEIRTLIEDFPFPMALLSLAGAIEFANERFGQVFESSQLSPEQLSALQSHAGRQGPALKLAGRDGKMMDARVSFHGVSNALLLVIDDTPGGATPEEINHLQQRIIELEKLSATDRLTGAWNRVHLDRMVESELARSLRSRQPLSLILLDIDHFKNVNDRFGHQAGDSVLRELVEVVRSGIRSSDVLFRWGGEEFVVLAPATGYRKAETVAEALRSQIEAHSFAIVGPLTISLGVAEHTGAESAADWFRRVDAALYAAKNSGRNRVSVDCQGNSDAWAAAGGLSALHLVWTEGYECGEPTIDAEHRELFSLANTLIEASLKREAAPEPFAAALDTLIAHIVKHFSDEEALLAKHHYGHLEAHRRAHAGLLARAQQLKASAAEGGATLGSLIEFLAHDVVARHLFLADRDFFPLFAKRGQVRTAGA